MILCDSCDPVIPDVCDFCKYFEMHSEKRGDEDGWCRLHQHPQDAGGGCDSFHCGHADKHPATPQPAE